MPIISPFARLNLPRDMACEFFGVFARFEYVLKANDFNQNRGGRIEPDWGKFGESDRLVLNIPPGSELESAIRYLIEHPPRIQTGPREWQARPLREGSDVAQALEAAQRTRNNLFHGGKFGPHENAGRDKALVQASLAVLEACLEQNQWLRQAYEQE